uniref:Putative ribonuclease H-like domain-containing protein n=1 Tax=Tanacetum cinerariifolium TaxID=118510 RepID=A0A6L2LPJ8_TANCI|nr:putative ribonuclease H-like domain-containing protein [Tanacetum cinerariifolium]
MTTEEHIAVQKESKARTTLLQSIPDDHVADFHYRDDARDIWNAVKARFGKNAESKKIRKSMLKQEFLEFRIGEVEGLHKGYDRMQKILSQLNQLKYLKALPSLWAQVALTLKTKGRLELLSFDDLYYKLKTLEVDVKGYTTFSSSQSAGPSHSAFVSATSASKKMSYGDSSSYSSTTTYSAPSNSKTGSHRSDFEQIEKLDLEEMDLKWQMAMISVRVHKFKQKDGRKIDFDKKEFARFNKKKETGKKEEDSKALITIDTLVDWTDHDGESDGVIAFKEFGMIVGCDTEYAIKEGAAKTYNLITGVDTEEASIVGDAREFALMGVTSEVHNCPFGCNNKYNELHKQYNELNEQNGEYFIQVQAYKNSLKTLEKQKRVLQRNQLTLENKIRVLSIELENTSNLLKHSERINADVQTAKKDLQTKLDNHLVQTEKWRNSSKNLFRLIDSSMTVRTKVGLGFNNCIRKNELGWDDSAFSVFTTNSEDVEGRPLFNRFAKADSMKVVPPPLFGDYTSLSDHSDLDESQLSYGTKSSTSSDSNVKSSEPNPNDSTSCASSSRVSTSENEAEIESNVRTPIQEPIIIQDLPSFSCNGSDKNENTSRTSCNKNGYKKAGHFRKHASSVSKLCFICGSGTHLIKDYDFYKKQMAKKIVGIRVGHVYCRNKVNHQNQFVLQAVLLRTGLVIIPPARPQPIPTGRPNRPFPISTNRGYSPSVFFCWWKSTARPMPHFSRPTSSYFQTYTPHVPTRYYNHMKYGRDRWATAVKPSAGCSWKSHSKGFHWENPFLDAENEGIFDSGCSRSMTGNKERLDDFQAFQGGKVTFGGDTECLVLSKDFKLPDDNMVVLKFPRKHNLYTINLNNLCPREHKDETYRILKDFINLVENQLNKKVKAIRCDNVRTVCYVLNRVSITRPHNKTPYALLTGNIPYVSHFKPFGCHVIILNTSDHLGKFDGKADEGYIVGYSARAQGATTNPIDTSGDKVDDSPLHSIEEIFQKELARLKGQAQRATSDPESLGLGFANDVEDLRTQASAKTVPPGSIPVPAGDTMVSTGAVPVHTSSSIDLLFDDEPTTRFPYPSDLGNHDPSPGIFSFSSYDDKFGAALNNVASTLEVSPMATMRIHTIHPQSLIIRDPTSAVQTRSKVKQTTTGKYSIRTKWILKNKRDARGIVVQNKVRLIAQGHRQEEGIDYDEVFAPVVRIEAIRLFLAFASYMGFIVYQMDVKSTFLYGRIDEEVYVTQPKGFVDPQHPKKVYKVVKALYGVHQAPRAWYATLATFLLKHGYRRGTIDKTLFLKKNNRDIILVQVYVDDIIFGSTKKTWCDEFEALMKGEFQMSDMGELTFFLDLQV